MIRIEGVLCSHVDPALHDIVHHLEHHGQRTASKPPLRHGWTGDALSTWTLVAGHATFSSCPHGWRVGAAASVVW